MIILIGKIKISAAIYPVADYRMVSARWDKYLKLLEKYSVSEIFTTIHLPEISIYNQVKSLLYLSKKVKTSGFSLSVDIGGKSIEALINDFSIQALFKESCVDSVRLDYGFSLDQLALLINIFKFKNIVINASLTEIKELEKILNYCDHNNVKVSLCHNFYPREESGLDFEFVLAKYQLAKQYKLEVMGCLPSHTCPRGPIYKGLTTIEAHRYLDLEQILLLTNKVVYDSYMIADEFVSEVELKTLKRVLLDKTILIPIQTMTMTKQEKLILKKPHQFRYDSNQTILRSRTSRDVAEFAEKILPNNNIKRSRGSITIDNLHYKRYSGELQVVLSPLPRSDWVNVVGFIDPSLLWKFDNFRLGYKYQFIDSNKK